MNRLLQWGTALTCTVSCIVTTGCGTADSNIALNAPSQTTGFAANSLQTGSAPNPQNPTLLNPYASPTSSHQVYVFSQPTLKMMYAVEYIKKIGPVVPPHTLERQVENWARFVTPSMLDYVPVQERSLDSELILNIQGSQLTPPRMTLLNYLPGYTLRQKKLSRGLGQYWYPADNQWPKWVDPMLR